MGKMGKKMIMRKLLSCFTVFAILMSAMPVSVFALNYNNASKDVSNYSNSNSRDSLSSSSDIIYVYALDNSTFTTSDPKPDLVIIDIWRAGGTIYYKIKNQGTANAGGSNTSLTVEGALKHLIMLHHWSQEQKGQALLRITGHTLHLWIT